MEAKDSEGNQTPLKKLKRNRDGSEIPDNKIISLTNNNSTKELPDSEEDEEDNPSPLLENSAQSGLNIFLG